MNKLKVLVIALVVLGSSVAYSNVWISTYSHTPCDSWSFDGTCNFHSFNRVGADGNSVQRALSTLDQKISNLEIQMEILMEENNQLKEKLNKK